MAILCHRYQSADGLFGRTGRAEQAALNAVAVAFAETKRTALAVESEMFAPSPAEMDFTPGRSASRGLEVRRAVFVAVNVAERRLAIAACYCHFRKLQRCWNRSVKAGTSNFCRSANPLGSLSKAMWQRRQSGIAVPSLALRPSACGPVCAGSIIQVPPHATQGRRFTNRKYKGSRIISSRL